jgi:hypothetical protein
MPLVTPSTRLRAVDTTVHSPDDAPDDSPLTQGSP